MSARDRQIAENVARVRDQISSAALRAGRAPSEITLVAVTKYGDVDAIRSLIAAGCRDLGESRPQDLWKKAEALRDVGSGLRWHMIGHLQRNKIRRTAPLLSLLHSADSERLLVELNGELQAPLPVLLEINVSGVPAKGGFAPDDIPPLLEKFASLENIRIQGAMTMAGVADDSDAARKDFAALRALCDQWRAIAPPPVEFRELSMGMSGDFEIAIEEGATIVRVGSALFEGLE